MKKRSNVPRIVIGVALTATLAIAAPAEGSAPQLGVSLKHLADDGPAGEFTGDFHAVAPTVDTMLTSIRWRVVQPTCKAIRADRYDWRKLNELMALWSSEGLSMTATLKGGPPCASTAPMAQPTAAYMDEWAIFARKVAARYGPRGSYAAHPLRRIEVWSEPNLKTWTTPPRDYARVFVTVARQIRAGNGSVRVVTGGLGAQASPLRFVSTMFDADGFRSAADQIGIHTYNPTPEAALELLQGLRRVIGRNGGREPLLVTEHGWSTCPRPDLDPTGKCVTGAEQALYLDQYVEGISDQNSHLNVTGFFWFMAQDFATSKSVANCPGRPKNFYGFFTQAGFRKPSADVWSDLTGVPLPDQIAASPILRYCGG